jgi:hypothetical protein
MRVRVNREKIPPPRKYPWKKDRNGIFQKVPGNSYAAAMAREN